MDDWGRSHHQEGPFNPVRVLTVGSLTLFLDTGWWALGYSYGDACEHLHGNVCIRCQTRSVLFFFASPAFSDVFSWIESGLVCAFIEEAIDAKLDSLRRGKVKRYPTSIHAGILILPNRRLSPCLPL